VTDRSSEREREVGQKREGESEGEEGGGG